MRKIKIPAEFQDSPDSTMIGSGDILKFFRYTAKSITSVSGYVDKGLLPYPIRSNKYGTTKRIQIYWNLGELRKLAASQ